jgi:hypothetical protein
MAAPENEPQPDDERSPDDAPDGEAVERPLVGRDRAEHLFFELLRDCGPDLVRMPSSCRVYLSRYLANHPEDADLLMAVVKRGTPTRLLQHESPRGYDALLDEEIRRFAKSQKIEWYDAKWAVECWAKGVGRPRGFRPKKPQAVSPAMLVDDLDEKSKYDNFVKAAMIFIVGFGGFFGTFVAIALIPIFMWALEGTLVSLTAGFGGAIMDDSDDTAVFLVAFLAAGGFGLVGAAAAIVAWIFAGGEEEPWATASVASGTAFTTVFICLGITMMCCIPPLFLPFVHIGCVFMATYKSAARGGNY